MPKYIDTVKTERRKGKSACAALALPTEYTIWVTAEKSAIQTSFMLLAFFLWVSAAKRNSLAIDLFLVVYGS